MTRDTSGEYLLKPQILHWEDRATEWSGKPDRVKVSLPLYKSGRLIGSALVSAKSSWWTYGGDHLCLISRSRFTPVSLAGHSKSDRLSEITRAEVLKFLREIMECDVPDGSPRVSDQLKAAEVIIKMCGWNEPEKHKVGADDELTDIIKRLRGSGGTV